MHTIMQEKVRECMHLFMTTDRQHKACCDKKFAQFGIHRSQHMLLMHLARTGKTACQREIAEKFDISPAAVAVTIKKLEKNGFICKKSSQSDNRFNEIEITEKGKQIVNASSQFFEMIDREMFKYLDESEIDRMIIYLEKIKKSLCELAEKESV